MLAQQLYDLIAHDRIELLSIQVLILRHPRLNPVDDFYRRI